MGVRVRERAEDLAEQGRGEAMEGSWALTLRKHSQSGSHKGTAGS